MICNISTLDTPKSIRLLDPSDTALASHTIDNTKNALGLLSFTLYLIFHSIHSVLARKQAADAGRTHSGASGQL